ncbi:NAD(P)/FAD-dependent oxidoreductase [Dactylococcopsis salina]|uniref:NAD/FAD-dependent oxidoreductase n=1 Tax=Dactylococcopsis salina (strain PCC 8305) TaxID=13035 RepID=K9YWZ1_DACS8|nr:FAD-dependent oxidoreductase [Dactylococcopsis salina]AFZ50835.1 putative NAD/FAD-dependent oxidoreductase [Dactylococcopsis salina PCC 8305]
MSDSNLRKDCLIIGGGLSGLVAAVQLQSQGATVKVLDKGRGIGGRLATRRINIPNSGEGIFDYGAQYITAQGETFQSWLENWRQLKLVEEWNCEAKTEAEVKQPKYRGVKGIRDVAKSIASDLDVQTGTKVVSLQRHQDSWRVFDEEENQYESDSVILTAPLPQSLDLLKSSQIPLSDAAWEQLSGVSYRMCLAVLLMVSDPILMPYAGGYQVKGEKLDWIACNHQKGISPHGYAVTLQGTHHFSEQHYPKPLRDIAIQELIAAARGYLGNVTVIEYQGHFWRYSTPIDRFPEPFFTVIDSLYLAGDGFVSGEESVSSLEGAFLSGWEVGNFVVFSQGIA